MRAAGGLHLCVLAKSQSSLPSESGDVSSRSGSDATSTAHFLSFDRKASVRGPPTGEIFNKATRAGRLGLERAPGRCFFFVVLFCSPPPTPSYI